MGHTHTHTLRANGIKQRSLEWPLFARSTVLFLPERAGERRERAPSEPARRQFIGPAESA